MSTGAQLVSRLKTAVMDTGDTIWSAADKLQALNDAIDLLWPHIQLITSTTITTVSGTQYYTLPAGAERVYQLYIDLGTTNNSFETSVFGWRVRHDVSPKKLSLPVGGSDSQIGSIPNDLARGLTGYPSGKTVRVIYGARLPQIANDATAWTGRREDEVLIVQKAKGLLYATRGARAPFNPREMQAYIALADREEQLYQKLLNQHRVRPPTIINHGFI